MTVNAGTTTTTFQRDDFTYQHIRDAIKKRAQSICLQGTFWNITEDIAPHTGSKTTIYGTAASIRSSTLTMTSSMTSLIIFENANIENTVLILNNIQVYFTNCKLENVYFQDIGSKKGDPARHIKIVMHRCLFLCSELDFKTNYTAGIVFKSWNVVLLTISETNIQHCTFNIFAYNVLLYVLNCNFVHTFIHVNSKSYINVPSVITFKETTFSSHKTYFSHGMISLQLHNPYIFIDKCNFNGTPVDVFSVVEPFPQELFYVKIVKTHFSNILKDGDGGALMFRSDLKKSEVFLEGCIFISNRAQSSSVWNPKKGGGIFVESNSLIIVIENSQFINNLADDSGSALNTASGVTVNIKNTSFETDIDTLNKNPLVYCLGNAILNTAHFKINNKHIKGSKIFSIRKATGDIIFNVNCPAWHTHVIGYEAGSENHINQTKRSLNNFMYECGVCPEYFYTNSNPDNFFYNYVNFNTSQKVHNGENKCLQCPYGALCAGNNVVPRPNYWGYWYKGKLIFQQCPASYCCSGGKGSPCKEYNSCNGNRTGTLCGACKTGFSISILTEKCVAYVECGKNIWFWFLAILATSAYAIWYTLKEDLLTLFLMGIGCTKKLYRKVVLSQYISNNEWIPSIDSPCKITQLSDSTGTYISCSDTR